ncbi:hypothetical protein DFQ27_008670 [Actinomortierella ambigua]|uniref:Uncharacterized protein n=1 Tax=Actinomortierella ambigua TaxID=1343610 RepID=A0A9P6QHW6_9FUNG|nr:hypothetical protein DFQ27_008670 [Actinomortierella ambigua]
MAPPKARAGTPPTITLLKTLLVVLLLAYVALAQAPPASNPQPGPGAIPQPTTESGDKRKGTKDNERPPIAAAAASSGSGGAGVVMTTVTMISGTPTTITITPTASGLQPPGGGGGVITGTPTVTKVVQSVLVVASTTYGRPLPAAGPIDDEIESHFWDRFMPRPAIGPGSRGSSGASLYLQDRITSCLLTQVLAMGLVVAVLTIDML